MTSSAVPPVDLDPVVASYDIYIKPQISNGRSLYILQFPNRAASKSYSTADEAPPSELRIKQKAGLLELDVPLDAWRNYDREKGHKWGDALRKTNAGVSHGLPGGFGIGGNNSVRARAVRDEDEHEAQEQVMRDFAGAVTNQRVLTKQTLGGMAVPKEDASPQYFIGAFKMNQLHLTPVDQIVQMRPQFHHIDAASDLERQSRARDSNAAGGRSGEARAIHMTVKSVGEEEESTDTMAERIRSAQDEKWRKLNYIDEDSEDAWQVYNDDLFIHGLDGDEEEGKEVPKLVSSMANAEYLDAISAPRDAARLSRSRKGRKGKRKEEGADGEEGESDDSSTISDDSEESDEEA